MGGTSERMKEVKRRRHRRQKVAHYKARLAKATPSERLMIAEKLRRLTPGAESIVTEWGLEDR